MNSFDTVFENICCFSDSYCRVKITLNCFILINWYFCVTNILGKHMFLLRCIAMVYVIHIVDLLVKGHLSYIEHCVNAGRQLAAGNNSSCSLRQLAGVSCGKHLEMCALS